MRYDEWADAHKSSVDSILTKLSGQTPAEIVEYFMYDNMKEIEPDFCPLYAMNEKCHDMKELNCLYCACPHFEFNEDTPLDILRDGTEVVSKCNIDSRFSGIFNYDNKQACNCSDCLLPHRKGFALLNIKDWKQC